jgi:WD40 repeat protein
VYSCRYRNKYESREPAGPVVSYVNKRSMELFASSSIADGGAVHVWDAHTCSEAWRGKSQGSRARTLCMVGPDVIAAGSSAKSEARFWSLSKQTSVPGNGRCSCWEPLSALAATADGAYCIGGSSSGKIYVWETVSGALLRFWDAHYSAVSNLAFTDDDHYLVSSEEHAYVKVWRISSCIDISDAAHSKLPEPFRVWGAHTLPVTDLVLGAGGGSARVFSASLDQSVGIWSIATAARLASVRFPAKCTSLALDPAERELYVGCSDAVIYALSLSAAPPEHWVKSLDGTQARALHGSDLTHGSDRRRARPRLEMEMAPSAAIQKQSPRSRCHPMGYSCFLPPPTPRYHIALSLEPRPILGLGIFIAHT